MDQLPPSPAGTPVVGVDLDNTLATYDALIHQVALELAMITAAIETASPVVEKLDAKMGEVVGGTRIEKEIVWIGYQARFATEGRKAFTRCVGTGRA